MFIGHLPAGYLLGRALRRRLGLSAWFGWELVGSVFPDIDLLWFYTLGHHKTLHHKRPELFPLLDNKTMGSYLPRDSWQIIHADLTAFAPEFAALEEWFAGEAAQRGKVGLTRLRMHDIILWLHASIDSETNQSQWETAVTIGTNDFGF